jgi:hypothetical protein
VSLQGVHDVLTLINFCLCRLLAERQTVHPPHNNSPNALADTIGLSSRTSVRDLGARAGAKNFPIDLVP